YVAQRPHRQQEKKHTQNARQLRLRKDMSNQRCEHEAEAVQDGGGDEGEGERRGSGGLDVASPVDHRQSEPGLLEKIERENRYRSKRDQAERRRAEKTGEHSCESERDDLTPAIADRKPRRSPNETPVEIRHEGVPPLVGMA